MLDFLVNSYCEDSQCENFPKGKHRNFMKIRALVPGSIIPPVIMWSTIVYIRSWSWPPFLGASDQSRYLRSRSYCLYSRMLSFLPPAKYLIHAPRSSRVLLLHAIQPPYGLRSNSYIVVWISVCLLLSELCDIKLSITSSLFSSSVLGWCLICLIIYIPGAEPHRFTFHVSEIRGSVDD